MNEETTHFGYREVKTSEKAGLVGNVFRQVAGQYDVMNDLMSLGTHRVMKRVAVELVRAKEGQTVLDIAGGTGDLTALLKERVGPTGQVILLDINAEMVRVGRDRLLDHQQHILLFLFELLFPILLFSLSILLRFQTKSLPHSKISIRIPLPYSNVLVRRLISQLNLVF